VGVTWELVGCWRVPDAVDKESDSVLGRLSDLRQCWLMKER